MKLFKRDEAIKKWHGKAWMVNPGKTKIVLVAATARKRKHLPLGTFRKIDASFQDMYALSLVRMQYCSPNGRPVSNVTETSDSTDEETLRF